MICGSDIETLKTEISDYPSLTSLSSSYSCVLHFNHSLHIDNIAYEMIGTVQRDLRNRGKQKKCIDVKMSGRALNRMLFNHNKSYAVKLLEMAKYYQRILENMYDDLRFYELYVGIIKFYETNGIPVSLIKNLSEKDLRFTDLFDLSLVADVVVKGKDVRKNVKSNSADIITKKVFSYLNVKPVITIKRWIYHSIFTFAEQLFYNPGNTVKVTSVHSVKLLGKSSGRFLLIEHLVIRNIQQTFISSIYIIH